MSDPIVVNATGSRIEHYGQHHESCFGCKLKSLHFGSMQPATHNPTKNPDARWDNDPVKLRMEELTGKSIDTDVLNRRRLDLNKENK